jgi:hypothetical protein
MLPNFIVIGAPRCGTTWVHDNLRQHPDIFLPKIKELHFFDNHPDKSIEHYESLFSTWSGQKAVGEITPNYLSGAFSSNRRIPELIHQYLPNIRLIAVLRNPVERAYSHYWFNVSQDARNVGVTFEEKLAQRPQIIEEGLYADHLSRYLSLFEKNQMLVLSYDDLKKEPLDFLRKIYTFLDVDPSFISGRESLNRNSAYSRGNLARSRLLWHAGRALAKIGLVDPAERLRRVNSGQAVPPMHPDTRRRLTDLYRPSNARLAQLIGRDLSSWDRE